MGTISKGTVTNDTVSNDTVHGLVDHLFRQASSRLVASLVRAFGPAHLDLAEEVVQDAMVKALRRWPHDGVPDRPDAWLCRVARNLALDRLRRVATSRDKEPILKARIDRYVAPDDGHLAAELPDDQLRLVFLCCHPELPEASRVALVLKNVGGFGVREIARAFLSSQSTMAQRLVRAHRILRADGIEFEVPSGAELQARLDTVLESIYLIFDRGYSAYEGDRHVLEDVCRDALRLAELLTRHPQTATPESHALASLLCFQASRLRARVDADGDPVLLDDQDRSLWDDALVTRGYLHLDRAASGERETTYHLQAAIAAQHASPAGADWSVVRRLYDRLYRLHPTPVVALNRAVAVAHDEDAEAGLVLLEDIEPLSRYHLLPSTRAELLLRTGDVDGAAAAYREALRCPCSEPEQRFLAKRLAAVTVPS